MAQTLNLIAKRFYGSSSKPRLKVSLERNQFLDRIQQFLSPAHLIKAPSRRKAVHSSGDLQQIDEMLSCKVFELGVPNWKEPVQLTIKSKRSAFDIGSRLFMVALSTSAFKSGQFEFPEQPAIARKDLTTFIDFKGAIEDDTYYLDEENRYHKMITGKADDPFSIYQLRKFLVRVKDPGVCPTLTANMGLGGHNVPFVFDAKGLRKLTEHECLRLQGFPEILEKSLVADLCTLVSQNRHP